MLCIVLYAVLGVHVMFCVVCSIKCMYYAMCCLRYVNRVEVYRQMEHYSLWMALDMSLQMIDVISLPICSCLTQCCYINGDLCSSRFITKRSS